MYQTNQKNKNGFTLIEFLVGFAIMALVVVLALPALRPFERQESLDSALYGVQGALRLAQSKTVASEGLSSWGVYFDTAPSPHQYILFKGQDYATRDPVFDAATSLAGTIEFSSVNVPGSQVVFSRITGETGNMGSVTLRLKADSLQTRSLFIDSFGRVESSQEPFPSDEDRLKDSRHVHVGYQGRTINGTDDLVLIFPNEGLPVVREISIGGNMQGGQFLWEGTIQVGGEDQTLKIHTHLFNDVDQGTEFSIHRQGMLNTKALTLELQEDSTGTILLYDDQGQTTQGTSLYASTPVWQ